MSSNFRVKFYPLRFSKKKHPKNLKNFWPNLESGIDVGVRLLILGLFPVATCLLTGRPGARNL